MKGLDEFGEPTPSLFEKVEGKEAYRINKNQFLKINKRGNGEIIAPIKDPITKKTNWNNLFLTGGTAWGTVKVLLVVALLLFLLWRYSIETADCREIIRNFNPATGCLSQIIPRGEADIGDLYIPANWDDGNGVDNG